MNNIDFDPVWPYLPDLGRALIVTVELALLALAIGLTFGLVLALGRMSRRRLARYPSIAYIEFFRTTPLIAQLLWVYFVVPVIINVEMTQFQAGALTLGLNTAAYMAEIYRSGLQAIDQGQRDAAHVLGLSRLDTFRFVVFRQAFVITLPPMTANVMLILKGTAYVSLIGVAELTYVGGLVTTENFRFLEVYIVIAVMYFLLIYPVGVAANVLERRLRRFQEPIHV